jgi:hypothetical protein
LDDRAPSIAEELRRQARAILAVAARIDPDPGVELSPGERAVVDERARQIRDEGHTPEHDAGHTGSELAWAAYCYLDRAANMAADNQDSPKVPTMWPWRDAEWKPKDTIERNLVVAAALVVAELDRRLSSAPST